MYQYLYSDIYKEIDYSKSYTEMIWNKIYFTS